MSAVAITRKTSTRRSTFKPRATRSSNRTSQEKIGAGATLTSPGLSSKLLPHRTHRTLSRVYALYVMVPDFALVEEVLSFERRLPHTRSAACRSRPAQSVELQGLRATHELWRRYRMLPRR